MSNFWFALSLTTFAGLSTGIGGAIAFFAKRTNYRFLSLACGFSAGVMLYVSFTEIMSKADESLGIRFGEDAGHWWTAGTFFAGIVFMLLVDQMIPAEKNPHEVRAEAQVEALHQHDQRELDLHNWIDHHKLHRMGLFTALAIAIHNFPEGLATFLAALENPSLGLAIAVAIALHNIPEGISVSVPIYYATGSRGKAFVYSMLSGLAEPAGAMLGYLVLRPFLSPALMGGLFGAVAGIMVYISLDELLPTARSYGKGHDSLYGLLAGMVVMALSLLMMQ